MSRSAAVVYWYDESQMRPDGGGLRVRAWLEALEGAGYAARVVGLWQLGGGVSRGELLSKVKRTFLPMPLPRSAPREAMTADLVVATVPGVFGDVLAHARPDRVILDWMDLWSVNARTVGDASRTSRPGGQLQSWRWRRRERVYQSTAGVNTFAGYDDFAGADERSAGYRDWLPTPVEWRGVGKPAAPKDIRVVGFIGNFDYPPNRLSLRSFLEAYSDRLEGRGLKVVVAGFGADDVRTWGFPVDVMGQVDDVSTFYESIDAAVVPVDHGGGIKVKCLEALAHGTTVFGTDHVRDGLSPEIRRFVLPIGRLVEPDPSSGAPVITQGEFEAAFSQRTFSTKVERALDAIGRA